MTSLRHVSTIALGMFITAQMVGLPGRKNDAAADPKPNVILTTRIAVKFLAFDASGSKLATLRPDELIKGWDPTRKTYVPPSLTVEDLGDKRTLIDCDPGMDGGCRVVAFSGDSSRVVLGSLDSQIEDNRLVWFTGGKAKVWSLTDGKPCGPLIDLTEPVIGLWLNDAGSRATAVCWSGAVSSWEVATGRLLLSEEGYKARSAFGSWTADTETKASFSLDGGRIAAVIRSDNQMEGPIIKLWHAPFDKEHSEERRIPNARCVASSPNGEFVAIGYADKSDLELWTFKDAKLSRTLSAKGGARSDVITFSSDGAQVLAGHDDGSVSVWEVQSGNLIKTITGGEPVARVRAIWASKDRIRIIRGGFLTEKDFRKPRPDRKYTILPLTLQDIR